MGTPAENGRGNAAAGKQGDADLERRSGTGTERIGRTAAAERPALTAGSGQPESRNGVRARGAVPELMDKPGLPALRDRATVPAVPELMDKPGLPALMDRAGPREAPALDERLALAAA